MSKKQFAYVRKYDESMDCILRLNSEFKSDWKNKLSGKIVEVNVNSHSITKECTRKYKCKLKWNFSEENFEDIFILYIPTKHNII